VNDLLFSALALLLLDQQSKRMAAQAGLEPIAVGSLLRIRHVAARRTIYSSRPVRIALLFIWVVAVASALILQQSGSWFQSRFALVGLGMALGGAAGNLLDILRHRYIVDFIDLGWWPVFNLADVAIVGGLVLALLLGV